MNPVSSGCAASLPGTGAGGQAESRLPLLILLHGTRMNGGQWAGYAEALADLVAVQTPDLPGHGRRAGEAFSLAQVVRDVEGWVAAAGERPVILAGHSLGGYAAMCYAERHPGRLAGLVLMGSAAEPVWLGTWFYRWLGKYWGSLGPAGMARLERWYFARVIHPRIWSAIQARGGDFRQILPAWEDVIQHCRARQLQAVQCPVLVLGGALDQLNLHARRFARAAPHGQRLSRAWRNHLWPMTHPDEVVAELRRWISQLPAVCAPADRALRPG